MRRYVSIRYRLLLINLTVSGLAILLVGLSILFEQYLTLRKSELQDLQVHAEIIGTNTSAALVFNDRVTASEILAALRVVPDIEYAILFDARGEAFADFWHSEHAIHPVTLNTTKRQAHMGWEYIQVTEPIRLQDELIGHLLVRSSLEQFWHGMWRQMAVGIMVLVGVFLLVWLLISRLHLAIIEPLLELTRLMQRVSRQEDFAIRATVTSRDELGLLARGFNSMLEQLQRRDIELEQHRAGLEELVGLRTRELEQMATLDALTGLPNRLLATDRLATAILDAERSQTLVALLFLDLDHFKEINNTLGHSVGDQLLCEVAARLSGSLRKGDTVACFGGDEFVVIMRGIAKTSDLELLVTRLSEVVAQPLTLGDETVQISASIGIALYPQDGDNEQLLLRNADTAMYRAKELGRNNHQYYTEELNIRLVERTTLLAELRQAVAQQQFELHYQAQADMASGCIVAMEALLRWNHPRLGRMSPDDFIGLAEESGLIVPIGSWVLQEGCRQLRIWREEGLSTLRLAINVAAKQLSEGGLVENVRLALAENDLPGDALELELTETDVMDNPELAAEQFRRLHALGASIAIDDFGMGYSSLSYLKRFSFDRLKIDQSFVRHMVNNSEDAAIVRTIIAIAHSLGMAVIAEGVEDVAAMNYLWEHGCQEMQGYLISRPIPAKEAGELLREGLPERLSMGD